MKTNESKNTEKRARIRIEILEKGPYALYGEPEMRQQFIRTDEEGTARSFLPGQAFSTRPEPVHLCRCGGSKKKPYCDGSHLHERWDPELTAPHGKTEDRTVRYESSSVTLLDDEPYCVLARFCEAGEGIWQAVEHADDPAVRKEILREAALCPGGRLKAVDKAEHRPEPAPKPGVGLIEDPHMQVSGGIRVWGGIPVIDPEGLVYEVRERAVLCRCGQSHNKPYCDGTHLRVHWQDDLPEPVAEPAEV